MECSEPVSSILERVLMVPPEHFIVEYKINPFMGGTVDKKKAFEQWNELKAAIEAEGVQVEVLDQKEGLPDMIFVCNTGIVYHGEHGKAKVYIARFRHEQRKGEQKEILPWFQKQNFEIYGSDYANYFEGGGDAFFSTYSTLWAGYGPRSDKQVYDKIRKMGNFDVILCELVHPNFYHLDTCLCLVDKTTMLYYPPALSKATQDEILKRMPDSIAVSDEEANSFVCNAITIRKTVISPLGISEETKKKLTSRNLRVKEIDMSEFMKSGGACQCLVLKL